MCLESVTSYATCTATFIHTVICAEHIAHTHRQLDNNPCPKQRYKELEVQNNRCECKTCGGKCERREEGKNAAKQVWTFEKEDITMEEDRREQVRENRGVVAPHTIPEILGEIRKVQGAWFGDGADGSPKRKKTKRSGIERELEGLKRRTRTW